MRHRLAVLCAACLTALASPAHSQVKVDDPWVRATVASQPATGAFMQITSTAGGRLVAVRSPVAASAEVHEMHMAGDVMQMRAMPALDLPAGRPVRLQPGSYHVMLLGLKAPVNVGDKVPLTLEIEGADGRREKVEVQAVARAMAPAR